MYGLDAETDNSLSLGDTDDPIALSNVDRIS
jgi:hypothetical protein